MQGSTEMKVASNHPVRCAVILAGGEGRHLRYFVRQLTRCDIPKQYVAFIGTRSMFIHTLDRAEHLIPADRVYTVLAQDHLRYPEVQRQIASRAPHTLVCEPRSKGTGPGLLLPLMHIRKRYPNAAAAILPSDHFILQEDLFAGYLQDAFRTVEKDPAKIVFLGAEPSDPEQEYGYILPDFRKSGMNASDQSIVAFMEEPESSVAARLISQGALWNTMVMVFRVETFLDLLRLSVPGVHASFQRISRALDTPYEVSTVETVYEDLQPLDFCKDLIQPFDVYSRNQFSVIPMRGVFWSDWGCAIRIVSVLKKLDYFNRVTAMASQSAVATSFSF
jgi:mannose-1-phosphate guanylyltransferase